MGSQSFDYRFEILRRARLHNGFLPLVAYRLKHQLFAGGWTPALDRELIERGQAVAVLPYDPVHDQVVLVEQFRVGAMNDNRGPWLLEIAAGLLEPGETFDAVAHRELTEETGCTALALTPIYQFYPSPGGSSEYVALYCALVNSSGVGGLYGLDHEHEDIRVRVIRREAAWELLASGKINTAPAIIALQWLQLNYDRFNRASVGEQHD